MVIQCISHQIETRLCERVLSQRSTLRARVRPRIREKPKWPHQKIFQKKKKFLSRIYNKQKPYEDYWK